jgi:hypothetical protein
MESWILLLIVGSNTGVGGGVGEIDRYPSLAACQNATAHAEMKGPDGYWMKIAGNQWACVPGRPLEVDGRSSARSRRR